MGIYLEKMSEMEDPHNKSEEQKKLQNIFENKKKYLVILAKNIQ